MQGFSTNPILNTPYDPPERHWELDGHGQPTGAPKDGRRLLGSLLHEALEPTEIEFEAAV